jgi:class 3 adenylate cyclase/hemoglobin-like flavoprotein
MAADGTGVTLPIAQFGASVGEDEDKEFMTEFTQNFNLLSQDAAMGELFYDMITSAEPVQTGLRPLDFWSNSSDLHTMMMQPIVDGTLQASEKPLVAGVAFSILSWHSIFLNVLSPGSGKVLVVVEDTCDDDAVLTYALEGTTDTFLGYEDLHEQAFGDTEEAIHLVSLSQAASTCEYIVRVYATKDLQDMYLSPAPYIYAAVVCVAMIIFIVVFIIYDRFVQHRQERVLAKAARSNAIVASLFPSNVRDRILKDAEEQVIKKETTKKLGTTGKSQLKSYLDGTGQKGEDDGSKPIADLFPHCTVMFGDIAGFTAWSSIREPCQVFQLLETLYNAFDEIAMRRRVYKVETIGDCYVAVTGLPEPRKDHATVMTRFAKDLLKTMSLLTTKLEIELGPDTGDLAMRIGLHSGPVTAGVLRGKNCRFQLFGDTVNTAARMESNGKRNAIHISEETAQLLRDARKEDWLIVREDKIVAKGKGELQTYFVNMSKSGKSAASVTSASSDSQDLRTETGAYSASSAGTGLSSRIKRLVTFNADLLARLLKSVVARRDAERLVQSKKSQSGRKPLEMRSSSRNGTTVLDEVVDILTLPKFNAEAAMKQVDPKEVELPEIVDKQIHEYVTVLAKMYRRDVPFHNFEHASHVTMSVTKLLSRIVAPDSILSSSACGENQDEVLKQVHEYTYGITSDPMTQFAAVVAALIHDVDHTGVPNAQLIKEGNPLAEMYKEKSVAEQNSVDLAWDLLMDDNFKDLRAFIYTNEAEEKHFRSLLVNLVLATDICDKELGAQRKARWAKAFAGNGSSDHESNESEEDAVNRKATIVLEHLIQASDVAHTMQHWHIYRKWNEKFFEENMKAFKSGRAEKDPSTYWYEGELGFFDFYIIPLAKKLKDCGVFGVASDEYLDYATKNRKEWELHGQQAVMEMKEKYLPTVVEEDEDLSCHEDDYEDSEGNSFDSNSALNLDQDTIFTVAESWELLRRIPDYEEKTGCLLFSVLFDKCPPAKVLFGFPISMDPKSDQLTKSKRFLMHARYMVQMLDKAVQLIGPDAEVLAEILHELGKKHVRLGVKEDFFPIMGVALIEALKVMLGSKWNENMLESWGIVYEALSSEMIKSMNNDKAVIASWNRLKQIENYQEVAGTILFSKLFQECPEAKVLFGFPADMDVNSEQMLTSTRFKTHAAYFIEMLDRALQMVEAKEIGDNLKRLGQMHSQFGVKEEYFTVMGDALFHALKETLKAGWTPQMAEAWGIVYGRLASQMIGAMKEHGGEES